MATFYVGYRSILAEDTAADWINTYTHKLGNYSNWQLMSSAAKPLTGAPDHNRVLSGGAIVTQPGVRQGEIGANTLYYQNMPWYVPGARVYGEGDVFLSRVFLGLEVPWKNSLIGAGNPVQNDFYGRYIPDLYRGIISAKVFSAGYGHTSYNEVTGTGGGKDAAYALWSNYFWVGVGNNRVWSTSSLGHAERYPTDKINPGTLGIFNEPIGQAESFGAFEPYIYKGFVTEKSAPLNDIYNPGHPYWALQTMPADQMPADYGEIPSPRVGVNHYGDDNVRLWNGVTSAKAL